MPLSNVETDARGCCWVDVEVELTAGERLCTSCSVRVALPSSADDNPWSRRGDDWQP